MRIIDAMLKAFVGGDRVSMQVGIADYARQRAGELCTMAANAASR